jgi:hypothetical protein
MHAAGRLRLLKSKLEDVKFFGDQMRTVAIPEGTPELPATVKVSNFTELVIILNCFREILEAQLFVSLCWANGIASFLPEFIEVPDPHLDICQLCSYPFIPKRCAQPSMPVYQINSNVLPRHLI